MVSENPCRLDEQIDMRRLGQTLDKKGITTVIQNIIENRENDFLDISSVVAIVINAR